MKRTIYWSVARSSGNTEYYFDKEKCLNGYGKGDRYIQKYDVVFYSLETELTDEVILALMNGQFRHSYLPNYKKAKRIK